MDNQILSLVEQFFASCQQQRLWSRMEFLMHFTQAAARDLRVHLSRADAGVPEQFLDDPQIRPMFQKMSRKTMPQHVRSHIALDPRPSHPPLDPPPKGDRRKRSAALAEKHIG